MRGTSEALDANFDWWEIRAAGIAAAHAIIQHAFERRLDWIAFIPFIGSSRIRGRDKLLRIADYLCAQMEEARMGMMLDADMT